MILILALGAFVLLALLEVPIGVALIAAGFVGVMMLRGSTLAIDVLSAVPFSSATRYSLFALPAFVLLGAVVSNSGIARDIFMVTKRLTRKIPNGVAVTTVGATTVFSGISGSSAADVASMGRLCIQEMSRVGYTLAQSSAVVAAAGAFAALIPPSIGVVLYAIIAGESVGQMLLAGIIPGLLSAASLMAYLMIRAKARNAATLPEGVEVVKDNNPWGQVGSLAVAAVLFVIVLGGLYSGMLTATEAASAGAIAAVLLVGILPMVRTESFKTIIGKSLLETVTTTAMLFLLVIGGGMVTYLSVAANLPDRIAGWVLSLPVAPSLVVAFFLLAVLILGTILDGLSIMLVTVPIVAPVVTDLGFDPIWFGILFLKVVEIGLITPPVGINVYIVAGMFRGLRVESVFKAVLPYVCLDLALVAVLFLNPAIITWLPNQAG